MVASKLGLILKPRCVMFFIECYEKSPRKGGDMYLNKRLERVRSTIDVVPAQEKELPLILFWEESEQNVSHWSKEKHLKVMRDPSFMHHTILAKNSNEPVGYAVLRKDSPDESSVEFIRLVIADEFKSRGYGSLYFEYIWDMVFSNQNIERIWHDVFADNHYAVRLYEKLGYNRFKEGMDPESGRLLFFYELTRDSYLARGA